MTKMIMSEKISRRRMFSLLGAAAALGFATPTVMLASDAEALRRRGWSGVRIGAPAATIDARIGARVAPIGARAAHGQHNACRQRNAEVNSDQPGPPIASH